MRSRVVAEVAHDLSFLVAILGVVAMFMAGMAGHETPNAVAAGVVLVKIGAGLFAVAATVKAVSILAAVTATRSERRAAGDSTPVV